MDTHILQINYAPTVEYLRRDRGKGVLNGYPNGWVKKLSATRDFGIKTRVVKQK